MDKYAEFSPRKIDFNAAHCAPMITVDRTTCILLFWAVFLFWAQKCIQNYEERGTRGEREWGVMAV